jgi:hypothetical protein
MHYDRFLIKQINNFVPYKVPTVNVAQVHNSCSFWDPHKDMNAQSLEHERRDVGWGRELRSSGLLRLTYYAAEASSHAYAVGESRTGCLTTGCSRTGCSRTGCSRTGSQELGFWNWVFDNWVLDNWVFKN